VEASADQEWRGCVCSAALSFQADGSPCTARRADYIKLSFRSVHLYAVPIAVGISLAQVLTSHWILSNVVALAFAYNAISLLYLDSFATGFILLGGLFFYDVWCGRSSCRFRPRLSVLTRAARRAAGGSLAAKLSLEQAQT